MTGTLTIAGLGPGHAGQVTPEVSAALAAATDVLGYIPYVARVAPRAGLTLHPATTGWSANAPPMRSIWRPGRQVVLVSSGDPGVFAMAAAVFEALEHGPADWAACRCRCCRASPRCSPPPRAPGRRSATISARSTCPTISSPGR
jgi:precorrin-3B C17-methyltransferase